MKLPSSVGQKKIKALEQMLLELGVGEYGGWAPQDVASPPPPGHGQRLGRGGAIPTVDLRHSPALPVCSPTCLQS